MPTYYEELCPSCNDGACCGDCDEDLFDEDLFDEDLIVVKKSTNKSILSEFSKNQAKKYNVSESIVIDALNNGETVEDFISCTHSNPYYNKLEVMS